MRTLFFLVGLAFFGSASPALSQAGSLDPTFGEDGVVTRGIGVAERNVLKGMWRGGLSYSRTVA